MLNVFNFKTYSLWCNKVPNVVTNLLQCVSRQTNIISHPYLAWGQFYTNNSWIAISIVVVVGWIVLFNVGAYFCLAKLQHIPKWNPFLEVLKQSSSHLPFPPTLNPKSFNSFIDIKWSIKVDNVVIGFWMQNDNQFNVSSVMKFE